MHPVTKILITLLLLTTLFGLGVAGYNFARAERSSSPAVLVSPMHPVFPLLDQGGQNVITTGQPVSALKTCGGCHDTEFIAAHSNHTNFGLDEFPLPGELFAEQAVTQAEINCFLCHTPAPDNQVRLEELRAGKDEWAATATLLGAGIVTKSGGEYAYAPEAFTADGNLAQEYIQIQDPSSQNCGLCHGMIGAGGEDLLTLPEDPAESWRTFLSGEVFSPMRLSQSGLNLAGKDMLSRSFDAHAERNLSCTDCHTSPNNPVSAENNLEARPEHLAFDPRKLELGEYLQQPVHQFDLSSSKQRCEGCHDSTQAHTWLPYTERHLEAVSCQTCHTPKIYAPAFQTVDWTVLESDGGPRSDQRGVTAKGLITGYTPLLLPRSGEAGNPEKITPFNLVAAWYWVSGDPPQPVSQTGLQAAWFGQGGSTTYPAEILSVFDADGSGLLEAAELALDTDAKVQLIASRLSDLGYANPRITGQIKPVSLNHNTATGSWATRDCTACHSASSVLEQPFLVSNYFPGGVFPGWIADPEIQITGSLSQEAGGRLVYTPSTAESGLYVLGNDSAGWIDLLGSLLFTAVLLGVAGHGALRFLAALRHPHPTPALEPVYMYGVYERLWHWLQTFTILALLFTGLIIHKPDTFGIFSFRYVVLVHNILAAILAVNAALSLVYHLASGEIRQYLPRPSGFVDQAITQALYYLKGIFNHAPHPFEKTPQKKLNPLQQITYFGLLNVLLPLQGLTGILMWGTQRWPELTARLGGLPFLAPFHTLIAWLFAAFIVGHVYLTTTSHAPLTSIRAMMIGWDELERSLPAEEAGD